MISIIVAIAVNNVIGGDGKLLWHIPKDLKYFKRITDGKTIIMGRKTFESLGRVLPNRKHVVLTRNNDFDPKDENVTVIHSVDEIRPYIESDEENFIIGGGQLFREMLPEAERLYITWIGREYEGDTTFPEIPSDRFILHEETEDFDEATGIDLKFAIYDRIEEIEEINENEDWDSDEAEEINH